MQKINLAFVMFMCLFTAACSKATPRASTISNSEIAAEQLVGGDENLGRVAVYFEKIDLKAYAYPKNRRGCNTLDKNVDLTAAYKQTIRTGFKLGFPDAEFVNSPLSVEEMKARNFQAQVRLKEPSVKVSFLFEERFFEVNYSGYASLKGTLVVASQTGAVRQKSINIAEKDEALDVGIVICDGALAKLIQNAATEAIKQFTLKNVAASKDMLRILNSQN